MAELNRVGDNLEVTLSEFEKAESLHGDLRLPFSAVRAIKVSDDVVHAVHGIKLPGSRWPGKFAVGTFITSSGSRTFAVVHHDTPRGLVVRLEGARYDELIVGCEDPEEVRHRLGDLP
jgi:hypothetical protein